MIGGMSEQGTPTCSDEYITDGEASSINNDSTNSSENPDQTELAIYKSLNSKSSGAQKQFSYAKFKEDISTVPIFTWQALVASRKIRSRYGYRNVGNASNKAGVGNPPSKTLEVDAFAQYSLLGFRRNPTLIADVDEPIFLNTNTPWSAFICGSQGSGKSHTLSCMLENCLYQSPRIGKLQRPLAGVVFHYDTYSGNQNEGGICEAAYLCSLGIPVKVLVPKANLTRLSALYTSIPGAKENLTVSTLMFRPKHLNIERMRTLMAFSDTSTVPLYMEVITMILRSMAGTDSSQPVDFPLFEHHLEQRGLSKDQRSMLNLRIDLLKSFMKVDPTKTKAKQDDIFQTNPGSLTIIDLTDSLIEAASACSLFDICLGIFLEDRQVSRVVALDEAHKYMTTSVASEHFTESLLQLVRQQRHLASRVIIATQEPTISPKLIDLCNFTIVHRFSSPSWLDTLRGHVAGLSSFAIEDVQNESSTKTCIKQPNQIDASSSVARSDIVNDTSSPSPPPANRDDNAAADKSTTFATAATSNRTKQSCLDSIFAEIIRLQAGEAMVFAPTALADIQVHSRFGVDGGNCSSNRNSGSRSSSSSSKDNDIKVEPRVFGPGILRMQTRMRLSRDGGRSKMAVR